MTLLLCFDLLLGGTFCFGNVYLILVMAFGVSDGRFGY